MSGCSVIAIAAVLLPLMILLGLKTGLIGGLTDRLLSDPRNLELAPLSNGRYGEDWFRMMRSSPDIAFLIPKTRSIATTVRLRASGGAAIEVELVPTAHGDPLIVRAGLAAPAEGEVVVTESAARRLKLEAGALVDIAVPRSVAGVPEMAATAVIVAEILPESVFVRDAVFAPLELLAAVEDYRDGFAVESLSWPGRSKPQERTSYASFRLYARTLDAVLSVRERVVSQGIELSTRADEIALVRSLERGLSVLYGLVAAAGLGGLGIFLGSSLWGNIERKRKSISLLRLLGMRESGAVIFPIAQAALIVTIASLLAVAVYVPIELLANSPYLGLATLGSRICVLELSHVLLGYGLTMALSLVAASVAAFWARGIEPGEGVNEL